MNKGKQFIIVIIIIFKHVIKREYSGNWPIIK